MYSDKENFFFNFWLFLCQSKDGQPLLLVAAEAGLDNIVAALLVAGTDPNGVHAVCNFKEIRKNVPLQMFSDCWFTGLQMEQTMLEPYLPVGLELCTQL